MYVVMDLVSAVLEAPQTAEAAPKEAARHQRGPRIAAAMNPAMSENSTTNATVHWVASGIALPPDGRAARKNAPRPTTMVSAPEPLLCREPEAEPDHEDEEQEEELGGEHRLDHAQLAEAERGRLQEEHHQHRARTRAARSHGAGHGP